MSLIDFFRFLQDPDKVSGWYHLIWSYGGQGGAGVWSQIKKNKKPVNNYQLLNDRLSPTALTILISYNEFLMKELLFHAPSDGR